ncbi:amino acid ABC transporter permease [Halalkalibacillus sediminis]|uniref:Amino acid ABC transporter permease n=1 Tax=Halalkalibacillus sediminis TaxID=2018042 RepID=A0A2I0QTJ0_9BACI|nr:ABC transporter permease [Halalkalibacillus sediminis]PKR77646.1 amino acid ABC transporter permease [Halalkalibacillus sediminis]
MEFFNEIIQYMIENQETMIQYTIDHILMVIYGISMALVVGVPLGVLAAKFEKSAPVILSVVNIIQIVPSLAMLAILMLYFGLGFQTAVIGLFFYSLLPIVRNTYVGIREVDQNILDAGTGLGMTSLQVLRKVQLPLSVPFLMAGLRVASVIAVGVACIAPYIGADGLGREIVSGISLQSEIKIYAGAIPAALLAIFADTILGIIEKRTKKRLA